MHGSEWTLKFYDELEVENVARGRAVRCHSHTTVTCQLSLLDMSIFDKVRFFVFLGCQNRP